MIANNNQVFMAQTANMSPVNSIAIFMLADDAKATVTTAVESPNNTGIHKYKFQGPMQGKLKVDKVPQRSVKGEPQAIFPIVGATAAPNINFTDAPSITDIGAIIKPLALKVLVTTLADVDPMFIGRDIKHSLSENSKQELLLMT